MCSNGREYIMGIIDFVILSSTGVIFVINLLLLIFSLKSTNDAVMRRRHKKTYMPVITLCVIVFTLYVFVVNIVNFVFN